MPDVSALLFVMPVAVQVVCFALVWRAPRRVPRRIMRALLLLSAAIIAMYAAYDADYTLLAGEALLMATGWSMAGASGNESAGGASVNSVSRSVSRLIKGASLFVALALVLVAVRALDPGAESYSRFVDEHIRARGLTGVALYLGLTALFTCAGVPRQVFGLAGGYAFGVLWGTAWATAGVTLGCMMSFSYARFLGQNFVQRRFGHRIDPLEKFLVRSPFVMTFIIRSLPVGNNLVTNILAGVSRIPALPFFAGSCVGYIAQNFIFALLGSGVRVDPFWRVAISAALFVLASLLGVWLYRRYKADVESMGWSGQGE